MANVPSASYRPAQMKAVVGPQFTVAHPIDLSIDEGSFAVTDCNGSLIFNVTKGWMPRLHNRLYLVDGANRTVLTFRRKIMTIHNRWQIFKGDGSDPKNLLCNVKISSILDLQTELDVFLAANTTEEVPNFKVKGSWFERSGTVYLGNSSAVIAKMYKKNNARSISLGKEKFSMKVLPNVDYAFIIALMVVLYENSNEWDVEQGPSKLQGANSGGGGGGARGGGGGVDLEDPEEENCEEEEEEEEYQLGVDFVGEVLENGLGEEVLEEEFVEEEVPEEECEEEEVQEEEFEEEEEY